MVRVTCKLKKTEEEGKDNGVVIKIRKRWEWKVGKRYTGHISKRDEGEIKEEGEIDG